MGITGALRARPFYTGSYGSTSLVPSVFPVAIAGTPYMIDTQMAKNDWRHETVPLLRQQSDDSAAPGEASLNPEGLWRRTWSTWHKGAGQIHRDRPESLSARFQESRGVNVWERYELTLLPAIDQKRTSSATNLKLVPCNDRLFLTDGASVVYTTDVTTGSPTWDATTGEPGGTILDMASDGRFVWITDGSNTYQATGSASPPNFASWSTQDADVLAFVKGRLVSAHDNALHTYDAAGTATAITIAGTLPSTFTFVGFTAGPTNSVIYAAGSSGDKSLIFRIGIREDGTGLDAAIVAAELPDGEIVRAIGSYLGFVMLGTDEGVRFAIPNASTGDLEIGALLETGSPCRCFEGQGPHVWFGWDGFTESASGSVLTGATWHGLGRLSLEEFTAAEALAPAYATDMMTTGTVGAVSSVVTFQGIRVWTLEGTDLGVYAQESTPGTGGYLLTGLTDYGFTGDKTAVELDIAYQNPTSGQIGAEIEVDDTGETSSAATITSESEGVSTFDVGPLRGSRFNTLVVLVAAGSTSPTVTSFTLKSTPGVESATFIQVPILLSDMVDPDGGVNYVDVETERNSIIGLWETRTPVTYTELDRSHRVTVEDYVWVPRLVDSPLGGFTVQGTMVVKMKEI